LWIGLQGPLEGSAAANFGQRVCERKISFLDPLLKVGAVISAKNCVDHPVGTPLTETGQSVKHSYLSMTSTFRNTGEGYSATEPFFPQVGGCSHKEATAAVRPCTTLKEVANKHMMSSLCGISPQRTGTEANAMASVEGFFLSTTTEKSDWATELDYKENDGMVAWSSCRLTRDSAKYETKPATRYYRSSINHSEGRCVRIDADDDDKKACGWLLTQVDLARSVLQVKAIVGANDPAARDARDPRDNSEFAVHGKTTSKPDMAIAKAEAMLEAGRAKLAGTA
jgi:hypothetical protein